MKDYCLYFHTILALESAGKAGEALLAVSLLSLALSTMVFPVIEPHYDWPMNFFFETVKSYVFTQIIYDIRAANLHLDLFTIF